MYMPTTQRNWVELHNWLLLPLFKTSCGSSERALVRIGHGSAKSKTPRDNIHYLIPSLSLPSAPEREEIWASSKEKWDQSRCCCCCHNAAVCFTDRQTRTEKSDFRSEPFPLTTFSTQIQQHNNNNKLYSAHHREGERKDRGNRCFQTADETFTDFPNITKIKCESEEFFQFHVGLQNVLVKLKLLPLMTKQCFINEVKMCVKVLLCCFWETESLGCASWEKVRETDNGSMMINSFH